MENGCLGISVSRFHAENLQYPAVEIKPLNGYIYLCIEIDVEELEKTPCIWHVADLLALKVLHLTLFFHPQDPILSRGSS